MKSVPTRCQVAGQLVANLNAVAIFTHQPRRPGERPGPPVQSHSDSRWQFSDAIALGEPGQLVELIGLGPGFDVEALEHPDHHVGVNFHELTSLIPVATGYAVSLGYPAQSLAHRLCAAINAP
jgi:hypothetical protein